MRARSSDDERGAAATSACAQRLRRSSDVRSVFAAGQVSGSPLLVVHGRRRPDDAPPRATVVAGRKVGNAVRRNRVKRRLRAAVAQTSLPRGVDLVIVGRSAAATAPFADLRQDLERAATNAMRRS